MLTSIILRLHKACSLRQNTVLKNCHFAQFTGSEKLKLATRPQFSQNTDYKWTFKTWNL